jgi:hemerythrin-like domain-containing protein
MTSAAFRAKRRSQRAEDRRKEASEMDAIRILKDEHRTIKRVLDALDQFIETQPSLPHESSKADLLRFVEFIRLYADRMHHGKEEEILFERMVASGFPKQAGPLAVMYHEHDQGRAFVKELTSLGEQVAEWSPADRKRLVNACRGYTELLRNHIYKEDNVLYPMAKDGLNAAALAFVDERVEEYETSEPQRSEKLRLEALASELTEKYGKQAA